MVLPASELKQRIAAARVLRGVTQEQLQTSLARDGLGRRELGRIERGDLPLTKIRRDALVNSLRVPERWFTSPSVDEIVGWTTQLGAAVPALEPPVGLPRVPLGDPSIQESEPPERIPRAADQSEDAV